VTLDRALENRFRIDIDFHHIYVDLDDCLLLQGKVNPELISFLYASINRGCRITLLTRHAGNLDQTLRESRLIGLFDHIEHITNDTPKSDYIREPSAIFIDDSFQERDHVAQKLGIPVFSPDMIEALS
jgi:hypothetical protein